MKKASCLILAGVIVLLTSLISGAAIQFSAVKTASAAISTDRGYFSGIMIATDGTNAVTLDIYDNPSAASGRHLIPTWVISTSAGNRAQALSFDPPLAFGTGLYVDVTCAGTVNYVVYYETK